MINIRERWRLLAPSDIASRSPPTKAPFFPPLCFVHAYLLYCSATYISINQFAKWGDPCHTTCVESTVRLDGKSSYFNGLLGGGIVDSRKRAVGLGDDAVFGPLGMCADLVFVHSRQEFSYLKICHHHPIRVSHTHQADRTKPPQRRVTYTNGQWEVLCFTTSHTHLYIS